MKRPVRHTRKHYTLVEIMVAMAILVIMMGFLFQFVIGAQRIWSASTRTTNVFDQAQLVLQLIEQDLRSVQIVDETEQPGGSIPMILSRDTQNSLLNLFLFAPTDGSNYANVGLYPVFYELDSQVLYRYLVDSPISLPFEGKTLSFSPHFMYGSNPLTAQTTPPNLSNSVAPSASFLIDNLFPAIRANTAIKSFIADGVDFLNIEYAPISVSEEKVISSQSYQFFRRAPKYVRIMLSMYDAQAVKTLVDAGADPIVVEQKKTETRRSFTKIVFLR